MRSPAIMSARIFGDSSRRVVERPPAAARSTSLRFAAAIGPNVVSSARRSANTSKNRVICASVHDPRTSNAATAESTAAVARACSRGRDVEQVAGVVHDDEAIARREPLRQIGGNERHAITAEHDRLPGREGAQLLDHDRRN